MQSDPATVYHSDLGFRYDLDAHDPPGGAYFYDFASTPGARSLGFLYTAPNLFPYLDSFGLDAFAYDFPDQGRGEGFFTTAPRALARLDTGEGLFR